jgi:ankyrin repeat protein
MPIIGIVWSDTLLLVSVDAGSLRCVHALLSRWRANADAGFGLAFFRAAATRSARMMDVMLRFGACPLNALMHAVQFENVVAVRRLLFHVTCSADHVAGVSEALVQACHRPNVGIIIPLGTWRGCAALRATSGLALSIASKHGHVNVVDALIATCGADVNEEQGSAIRVASMWGQSEVVEKLLALGADPLARNGDALVHACERGHLDVACHLVARAISLVDLEAAVHRALHRASAKGDARVMSWLASVKRSRPIVE